MPDDIILIGPVRAGKSTQGRLLAEALDRPQYSMDKLRWEYYREIGYDDAEEDLIFKATGWPGVLAYWKPFEAHAVERLLAEHQGGVVDFGAGHSVHEDPTLFERVRQALAPYPNVVLLLPSPDVEESIRVSKERKGDLTRYESDFDVLYVTHPSNPILAKHVVYTEGKAPEETRDEILARLGLTP